MGPITLASLLGLVVTFQLAVPPAGANMAPPLLPEPAKCTPLRWDADKTSAAEAVFEGKLAAVIGEDAAGRKEPFWVLALTKPVCDPDGKPVPEVQVFASDEARPRVDLAGAVGKRVSATGPSFVEMTAHHHRPIVVEVTKLVVAK